jgi:copper transport protein
MIFNKRIFIYIITISIIFFSFPTLSSAHAYIIKSFPVDNQNLHQPPQNVSIEFSEEIQPSFHFMQVIDQNGKRVDQGNEHIESNNPKILKTNVKPNLPVGIYTIKWKIVSADGHPVDGVIPFQIGKAGSQISLLKGKTLGYVPHLDLIIIRWAQYISGAIYIGMLFFYLCILPKGSLQSASMEKQYRWVFNVAYVLLFLSIFISLPLEAVVQTNRSWLDVWDLSILKEMISNSTFGQVWLYQFILTLLLGIFSFRMFAKKNNGSLWIAFIIGITVIVLKAMTSHASSAENKILTITMDSLHLVSASIWIGSLIAMLTFLPLRKKEEGRIFFRGIVHLFFPWGVFLVFILAASGVYSSFLYIPTISSIFHTNYGKVLLGKIVLFFIMLLFAFVNSMKARKLKPNGWRFTLWGEAITGLAVLVMAVILTNLPTAMSAPGPFNETKALSKNTISLKIGPNISGQNTFNVVIKDQRGKPITKIEQVSLTFTSKEMAMGDNTINAQKKETGRYQAQGMYFNMAGRWNVHVHVLTKSLEDLDADFSVLVGSQ